MDDEELLQALVEAIPDEVEDATRAIKVHLRPGESEKQALARHSVVPEYLAAGSIDTLTASPDQPIDLNELTIELENQTEQLKNGESGRAESILCSQSHTLDAMFHHLVRRAMVNINEGYAVGREYLKLGMKAQSQCRATVDSLSAMRQPVIRQTNIAHTQQVNNFPEKENPQDKLLEQTDGERLDPRTPSEAVKGDTVLETVGAKHRAKNT